MYEEIDLVQFHFEELIRILYIIVKHGNWFIVLNPASMQTEN